MGGLRGELPHKLPDMEILRNLESPFILWIQIDVYFLASTSYVGHAEEDIDRRAHDVSQVTATCPVT